MKRNTFSLATLILMLTLTASLWPGAVRPAAGQERQEGPPQTEQPAAGGREPAWRGAGGETDQDAWEPMPGPYGGSVAALAVSPAYPEDHMAFAGLRSQGVYRTNDSGTTWQLAGLDGSVVVALALSPAFAEDRLLFATTGMWPTGYSVHRSADEGGSWQDITPPWTGLPSPPGLAVSPDFAQDRTLYVTGGYQTFVSTDSGDTFVQPGGWFATHDIAQIAFSPAYAVDRTLFARVPGEGLYKSVDGGLNWNPAGPGVDLSTLAVSPDYAADATLLALAESSGQLYASYDGGANWSMGSLIVTPGGHHSLHFSPTFSPGERVVLAASSADLGAYRSEDGGATWAPVGWYDPAFAYEGGFVGGSVYALALAPTGSWDSVAFAATSSGLYRSNDRGIHWWRHDDGPARLTVRTLAVAPGDPDTLLAGTSFFEHLRFDSGTLSEYDGSLHVSYDGGLTWRDASGRLDRVQGVAFSPAFQDDGTAFAATGALGQHGFADGGVYRSTDGGQNWEEVIADRICHALAVSPAYAADQTVWVAESTYSLALGLYVSADGGETWSSLAPAVHAAVLVPSPNYAVDHTLFAGTADAGLQRSTDAGATWTPVLTQPVTALAVSPAYGASRTLYAGVRAGSSIPGEIYRSADGGDTWQHLDTGIPPTLDGKPVTLSALAFAHDGTVLAGVYYGAEEDGGEVYRSADGGTLARSQWQPVGTGLADASVLVVAGVPVNAAAIRLMAGGIGGLWQIDLPQGGPAEPGMWDSNGPRGGRALAMDVSPDFPSDGLALTGEWIQHRGGGQSGLGILKSVDHGLNWQWAATGTESVAYGSAVHDFAFSPDFGSDGIIFAATWGGLFRSTDGGQTWPWVSRLYAGPFGSINYVAVAPDFATSGHVLATGGWGGLMRSDDGGIHWTSNYSLPVSGPVAYSPEFAVDRMAFVGGWYGLQRTTDAGTSWTQVLTTSVSSLAVSPGFGTDGTVFVGADVVYISHDAGMSWISATLPFTPAQIPALVVSPGFAGDQTLFAGTADGLFESHNGGLSWAAMAGFPVLPVRSLAISPGWPAHPVLLAGTDHGVYCTTDGGLTWALAPGLTTLSTGTLAQSRDGSLLVTGAYRHGLYASSRGGASWSALGLQGTVYYRNYAIAISPAYSADRTIFASFVSQESIGSMIYRTQDGGATWDYVYSTGYIPDMAISPEYATDHTVLAAVGGPPQRSQDGGDSWATAGSWPPGSGPSIRLVDIPPGGTLLAAGDGLWRLPSDATVWQLAASGLVTGTDVTSLAISPGFIADDTLLATASWTDQSSGETRSGVWRSTDEGVHWLLASTGLPANGIDSVVFSAADGTAYAISDGDLYRSLDGGQAWTLVGRPPIASTLADVLAGRDGSVYVATQAGYRTAGEGVWRYATAAYDIVVDGGFEADSGWEFPSTSWPAGYSDRVAYDRLRSARIGVDNGLNSQTAYSSARQVVAIPADVLTATLRCAVYPLSGESTLRSPEQVFPNGQADGIPTSAQPAAGDAQYLMLLDPDSGAILDTLFWQLSNAQYWQHYEFDLASYAGRSVKLHFGVLNDAAGGRTGMYVDDVSVVIYRPAPVFDHERYLPLVLKRWS